MTLGCLSKKEKIVLYLFSAQEKSLIRELWEYFDEKYFSPDMPRMENIKLGTGTLVTLKTVLIGITLGIIFASFITIYNKRYLGGFIRKLLKEQCISPSSAKTLEELGYNKKLCLKLALRTEKPLSRWARCVEEDEFIAEMEQKRAEFEEAHKDDDDPPRFHEVKFKRDMKTMHFYIPEEKKYAADVKFDAKGANWVSFILVTVISILICAFLSFILPDIVKMVDNFISIFKTK